MEVRHDVFLYEKEGKFHFGCSNPFCCHGNPGLPNHFTIGTETEEVSMKLVSHGDGKVKIKITPKVVSEKFNKGVPFEMECADNFEALGKEFDTLQD